MRKPDTVEKLYLDFDGFFASVEQAARPALRGRPVGVVPFEGAGDRGILIACSREAKQAGVKNVMRVSEARSLCPDLVLVPQSPDLYRRAHNALIAEIMAVLPIAAVKSIDELTCDIAPADRERPEELAGRIKARLRDNIGLWITTSIGIAANRQLAKMACKAGKWRNGRYGDGLMVWRPESMPGPLLPIPLADVPGIGARMAARLARAGIRSMADLLATAPKQMRALWGNVTGERLWYALHGYALQTPPQQRGMYGHGRVLPPESRSLADAYRASRLLLTKAARRMRRDRYNAGALFLHLATWSGPWSRATTLPEVHDDLAILEALRRLWRGHGLPRSTVVQQVSVALGDLSPADERQLDILLMDDHARQDAEKITEAIDRLNTRYGRTVVSVGPWRPPAGGYAGGKIAYTRIPSAEDFW
ncbi:MAG TPA: type VI secretion protein ImpB [Xanthobacteraceae bacterium]|nr:type VI secretion protein ImpB [Xanthobacteraceae bacterium]